MLTKAKTKKKYLKINSIFLGGYIEDGRGLSVWDTFTHDHPELITDGSNGDVGPYSYRYYEDDINAIKSMGVS